MVRAWLGHFAADGNQILNVRSWPFLLLIIEESDLPQRDKIFTVTVLTVALSALLHDISAAPLASAYARLAAGMGECEENMPAVEIPLREGHIIETKQG